MTVVRRALLSSVLITWSALASADLKMDSIAYLNLVRSENLAIRLAKVELEASIASSAAVRLPAPIFGILKANGPLGDSTGFEVEQGFAFPTTLLIDRSERRFEAEARAIDRKLIEQEILIDARFAYFQLWLSQEKLNLMAEKRRALEEHLKLATAGTRSDSFLKVHSLKVESDLDILSSEILLAQQDLRERQIAVALFINRDPSEFKIQAEDPKVPELPSQETFNRPNQVVKLEREMEKAKASENKAVSAWLPEFSIKYREMNGLSGVMMNSRELMLSASLPFLYFWQPFAEQEKAGAERFAAEVRLAKETQRIRGAAQLLRTKAELLRKQLELIDGKILPRAEKRMRLVHNLAPRDMETLLDHRETMEALPDLKLKKLELRSQYEEVLAELSKFAGKGS